MPDLDYDRYTADQQRRGGWEAREYVRLMHRPVVNLYPHDEQWTYTGRKLPRQDRPDPNVIAARPASAPVAVQKTTRGAWEGMDAARAQWEAETLERRLTCKHDEMQDFPATSLGANWRKKAYGDPAWRGARPGLVRYCKCGQRFTVGHSYRDGRRIMLALTAD